WICRIGLEWAYRFMLEPRRMWKRNCVSAPKFLWLVISRQHVWGTCTTVTVRAGIDSARRLSTTRSFHETSGFDRPPVVLDFNVLCGAYASLPLLPSFTSHLFTVAPAALRCRLCRSYDTEQYPDTFCIISCLFLTDLFHNRPAS